MRKESIKEDDLVADKMLEKMEENEVIEVQKLSM